MRLCVGRALLFATVVTCAALPSVSQARPGDLDPSFSTDGFGQYEIGSQSGIGPIPSNVYPGVSLAAVGLEPDGDVIAAGTTTYQWDCTRLGCFSSRSFLVLARVQPNGELDPSFGDGGVIETDFGLGLEFQYQYGPGPASFAVQDDGRILAVFDVLVDYVPQVRVVRFLADGRLDPSFSGDGIAAPPDVAGSPNITALAIQEDGRIVLGGRVYGHNYSGLTIDDDFFLARVLPDGTPDPAFGGGDGAETLNYSPSDDLFDLALDDEGRIVAAGTGSHAAGLDDIAFSIDLAVARFLPDGSPDPSFSGDGYERFDLLPDRNSNAVFGDLALAGNLPVVLGAVHADTLEGSFAALVRFGDSGGLDPSFGSGGVERMEEMSDFLSPGTVAIAAQPDGSTLIASGSYRSLLLGRRLPNGAPDPGFGDAGWLRDYPPAGFSMGTVGLVASGARATVGGATAAGPPVRAQLARLRLDTAPPDDRDADRVLDPDDRCPGVYAPSDQRRPGPSGCPPPFSLRVTLDRWKGARIGGELSGDTVTCVPLEMRIFRVRPGHDRRVARVPQTRMGIPDDLFASAFEGGWSVPRAGALRRGGALYVRAAPRLDPSVGKCKGDRSKPVEVPRYGRR